MNLAISFDMVAHMKTTIEIADDLFARARALADNRNLTFRALVEDGLRRLLAEEEAGRPRRVKIKPVVVTGEGFVPEKQGLTWQEILDEANERPHDWR